MPKLRILGFDLENKPSSYNGEFPTAQVTAISACWAVAPKSMRYWLCSSWKRVAQELEEFRVLYNAADIVTGHYIRKHDLPMLNGMLMKYGRAPLLPKLTIDTKSDWLKKKDVSASLENMLKYYGIPHSKVHVSAADWEAINEREPWALKVLRQRCIGDTRAQLALMKKMARWEHLGAPKVWRP